MSIIRIDSHIPYDSNIYLLTGKSAILIDTGTGKDSSTVIDNIWKSLSGLRLSSILLTHCHADHTGGLSDLIEEFGCPAYISECEVPFLSSPDEEVTFASPLGVSLKPVCCKKLLPSDVFDIGDHRLSVIPTPGHTVGSVSFYDSVTGSMFSGDTVFAQGYGRTDLPTGSSVQMHDSLSRLRNVNIGTLYPGHGPSAVDGNKAVMLAIAMMEMSN